ncbi:ATP-dependent helicase [Arthrobacter russicus]|uniref:DNA 3'-5' helicase n=1 Tax=Arthrobacter russicus TaxID=172040 RepID=A0ABU1J8F8_9MICC|nr:ATP-dependent DNA helicase [Arthrobacter russicus]MDR6268704.1 DNA helicase-2/ATP-dependent DNA helicase PcrA [Arthrobacter russicus]
MNPLQPEPAAVRRPTDEQLNIIEAPLEPMLVIAGAGSGKTTTMADRVVHLVAQGLARPEDILGVTFTRKAAGELAAKVRSQLRQLALSAPELVESLGPEALGPEALEPVIATYHSYANSIVADYGLRIGVERDATVLGQAQCWQLASQVVEGYDGDLSGYSGSVSTLVQAVVSLSAECSEHLRDPAEVESWLASLASGFESLPLVSGKGRGPTAKAVELGHRLATRARVADLVRRYQRAKAQRNALDYGDLVALAAKLAQRVPAVAEQERQKHPIVLLDEFQDTSHAQLTLFASLFGGGHPVTAVGDPHQSIYGFRGASAGQLFRFPEIFRRADGRPAATAALTIAWRNSLAVLDAANVMSRELNRSAQQQHADSPVPLSELRPRPDAPAGEVALARFGTETDEAAAIAEDILDRRRRQARLVEREQATEWDRAAGPEQRSIAVLCRRRAQFGALQEAFDARGLDYEIVGLSGLLATPEVIDLVSSLRVLVDPSRSDALMRLLSGARWRIGAKDLMALADWSRYLAANAKHARNGGTGPNGEPRGSAAPAAADDAESASLVEALDALDADFWPQSARELSPVGRARMLALRDELRGLRRFVGDDLLSLIGEVERTILLDIELAAKPGLPYHRARHHLDAFQDAAAAFLQSAERVDVAAFLAWLGTAEDEENGLEMQAVEPVPGAVQLLTVHAAKGLEWDEVYVPGLAAKSFPSDRAEHWGSGNRALPWPLRGDQADLPVWELGGSDQKSWLEALADFGDQVKAHAQEEERRLAYVAYTRARNYLAVSTSKFAGTAVKAKEVSPFLAELVASSDSADSRIQVSHWPDDSELPEENPQRAELIRAQWPYDPLTGPELETPAGIMPPRGNRRLSLTAAAGRVGAAAERLAALHRAGTVPELTELSPRWGTEARRLLERRASGGQAVEVELPAHISASTLVELQTDPQAVIQRIRRPVPRKPGISARKGTAFHSWVEEHFGRAGQLDLGEFPGSADDFIEDAYQLDDLKRNFEASEWADRVPEHIEVPIETRVAEVVVRGRIDAVFRTPDGDWELVDWKTGRLPRGKELRDRTVQLALYRLAWARLHGVPVERVSAAFYYVAQNHTERVADLAGPAELEAIVTSAYAPELPGPGLPG